jgi:hypothetical protein
MDMEALSLGNAIFVLLVNQLSPNIEVFLLCQLRKKAFEFSKVLMQNVMMELVVAVQSAVLLRTASSVRIYAQHSLVINIHGEI